jgi:hypothetical protein
MKARFESISVHPHVKKTVQGKNKNVNACENSNTVLNGFYFVMPFNVGFGTFFNSEAMSVWRIDGEIKVARRLECNFFPFHRLTCALCTHHTNKP